MDDENRLPGACYAPTEIYNTSIILTHWGRKDLEHSSNRCVHVNLRYFLYRAVTDVALPHMICLSL